MRLPGYLIDSVLLRMSALTAPLSLSEDADDFAVVTACVLKEREAKRVGGKQWLQRVGQR